MKRFFLTLLTFFLLALSSLATDVSGPVSGTWTLPGSPYNVIGEISIPAGQELVIEPGVQVIFQGWYKFLIYGRLQAVGTEADSILFTSPGLYYAWHGLRFHNINSQPDSSRLIYCKITYGQSSWASSAGDDRNGGVIFCLNSSNLKIQNCLIAYNWTADVTGGNGANGYGGYPNGNPGGSGENAETGNGGAIYLGASAPLIDHNAFIQNRTGHASGGHGGWGGTPYPDPPNGTGGSGGNGGWAISGCGGAIYCQNSSPIISGNSFSGNYTGEALGGNGGEGGWAYCTINAWGGDGGNGGFGTAGKGGAIYSIGTAVPALHNNLFSNIHTGEGHGGSGGEGGRAEAPAISQGGDGGDGGNGTGGCGGVVYLEHSLTMQNITLTESTYGGGAGGIGGPGGFGQWYGSQGSEGMSSSGMANIYVLSGVPEIANSIFWNNQGFLFNNQAQANHSCIQGSYPGIGNIDANPLFVTTPAGDCFLSQIAAGQIQQSPCVDSGNPDSGLFLGTTRTDSVQDANILDMGFHHVNFNISGLGAPVITGYYPTDLDSVLQWAVVDFGIQAMDPNGDSLRYSWRMNNVLIGSDSTISITFTDPGEVIIRAYASDGMLTDSVQWTVTVVSGNSAPSIISFYPAELDTVGLGAQVNFGISAIDPDGDSLLFSWILNGAWIGSDSMIIIAFDSSGDFVLIAVASDGQLADSVEWLVVVTPDGNSAPIIVSYYPVALDTVPYGSVVEFGIHAYDPDGDSLTYFWVEHQLQVWWEPIYTITFDSLGTNVIWGYVTDGALFDSVNWTVEVVVLGVPKGLSTPSSFFLESNHPNPFNPSTTITFGLPVACWVKVEVFDIAGRIVGADLKSAPTGWHEAGVHEVTFNASDLPSGIYLVRLQAGDFSAVEKMVLLK